MIPINYRDARPLHEQIEDGLRKLILTGAIAAGERLPSVREMASQLAINPNTIQRAYRELEREGFLYSQSGRGCFAANPAAAAQAHVEELLTQFARLTQELLQLGVEKQTLYSRIDAEQEVLHER